jgi:hypothetical protein
MVTLWRQQPGGQQVDRLASPFPGMDPFLEEPSLWGSVYTRLMNSNSDQLAGRVSPDFYVDIQQYVTILHPETEALRYSIPDVYVAQQRLVTPQQTRTGPVITRALFRHPDYALPMCNGLANRSKTGWRNDRAPIEGRQ